MRSLVFFAAFVALGAPAGAQEAKPASGSAAAETGTCKPSTAGEVIVCGERAPSPYRLDPDVLQTIRRQEQASNPPRVAQRDVDSDTCTTGPNGCPGAGALPIMAIAVTAAEMAVKAMDGEDWREPLRTRPDEYQLYREEKMKRERSKPKIGIGIGISTER
jgi:hypothetical protein